MTKFLMLLDVNNISSIVSPLTSAKLLSPSILLAAYDNKVYQ